MAEEKTGNIIRLMTPPRGHVQGLDGRRALEIDSRRPHNSVVYLAASCVRAHPTPPFPANVKSIERRRGMEATMRSDFDYEATIASFMAAVMAAICWGVLIAPLAG
jgi:hypothetical protein